MQECLSHIKIMQQHYGQSSGASAFKAVCPHEARLGNNESAGYKTSYFPSQVPSFLYEKRQTSESSQSDLLQTPTRQAQFDYYETKVVDGKRLFNEASSLTTPVARAHRSSGYSSSQKKTKQFIQDNVTPASSRHKNEVAPGHKKQAFSMGGEPT